MRYIHLIKLGLSASVAFSASIGYIMLSHVINIDLTLVFIGVFLMAAGSACINQIQECRTDKLMERTRNRPIPSGLFSVKNAIILAFTLCTLGFIILIQFSITPALLGLLNIILYNLVYTPLKYRSSFALLAGALVGAIPPLIGWTACGGNPINISILLVCLFIFLWQIPHFWFLLTRFKKDYKAAGIESVSDFMSNKIIQQLNYLWLTSAAIVSIAISFLITSTLAFIFIVMILNIALFITLMTLKNKSKLQFIILNMYLIVTLTLLGIFSLS